MKKKKKCRVILMSLLPIIIVTFIIFFLIDLITKTYTETKEVTGIVYAKNSYNETYHYKKKKKTLVYLKTKYTITCKLGYQNFVQVKVNHDDFEKYMENDTIELIKIDTYTRADNKLIKTEYVLKE